MFIKRLVFTAFSLFLGDAVLQAASHIPLLGQELYPEGIAVDQRTGRIYVGSAGDGSIQVVENGVAQMYQPAGTDGRTSALGVKVDEAHDRLLVVDGAAIYVYSIAKTQLLKKTTLSTILTVEQSALNDMAIDALGNVYITDSFNPYILKMNGSALDLEIFCDLTGEIPYGQQNGFPYNLNGILLSADQQQLITVKTNDGTLWKIDISSKDVKQIMLSEPVTKGDGLVWGPHHEVYIMRNYENKISRIDFNNLKEDRPALVETFTDEGLHTPTTAVYLANPIPHLTIVNSQFGQDPLQLPFDLLELPLSQLVGFK